MEKIETDRDVAERGRSGFEQLLRDGIDCLGFSGLQAEHSVASRTIHLRGVELTAIPLNRAGAMNGHHVVLTAALYGEQVQSAHALQFLFEINLANTLAGAGAFGRDKQGNLLLLKVMRCDELDGMSLAAHMQWMVALVESVKDELCKIH